MLTDASGGVVGTQTYLAYGGVRTASGNLYTDYTFTGQKSDADQFLFYQARYYDSSLNRWVQPDSIVPDVYNPQSLNRYAYVTNNPVKYRDPSGHRICEDAECKITLPDPPGPEFNATEWDTEHVDDEQLIDQVISDAGIRLCGDTCEGSQVPTLSQKKVVLRSVYTMQHRLRGGMEQLAHLLAGDVTIHWVDQTPWVCNGNPCAPP